jgi:NAD(P)-dependent dehydrogenase (short-subunit alcohol dehydrogenase family)
MNRLQGKVALITGSASGMGLEDAKLLASEGATVVLSDIADDAGVKASEEINAAGGKTMYIHLDVTSQKSWDAIVSAIREKFGRLDILVNNAGMNALGVIPHVDINVFNKMIAVNTVGPLMGIQACAGLMRESGGGAIVNIASTVALSGHVLTAYSASKWALRAISKSAALNLAKWNIRSNVICPGLIDTPLSRMMPEPARKMFENAIPFGHSGVVEDIAQAVLYLVSDESKYISGIDLPVDGGFTSAGAYATIMPKG